MLWTILTWAGAILGLGVLAAMALGAVALDVDDARRGRRRKREDAAASASTAGRPDTSGPAS